MKARSQFVTAAIAVTAGTALCASGVASASASPRGNDARVVLASTAPGQAGGLTPMAASSRVQVSVSLGRDRSGLAALAMAVSDPASKSYDHFLSPAQVQARFGATASQQRAVSAWLAADGLRVIHRDAFSISATGTVRQAGAALDASLRLSRSPRGGAEQVVGAHAMSVPAAVAAQIATVRVAPAAIPMGQHQPMKKLTGVVPGSAAAVKIREKCSAYYGQKRAAAVPGAYGKTLAWAPCGYLPSQVRAAYGATKSGLTGHGSSVAILSEDNDFTARPDADRWAHDRNFPPFAPGQFTANIAARVPNGVGDGESALDVESVHGMAPGAHVAYVVGNGTITGDRLLDALDTVVTSHLADVVTSSWFEGYMPVPRAMITAWRAVLQRAAVEGITVNFATGDFGDETPLQYPGSDPWITTVGGTSLAIGANSSYLWETGWETDETGLNKAGTTWAPSPPGDYAEGSTGGVSKVFTEPYYQAGIVRHNLVHGQPMRVVPDVSALGDWNLGYQIGLSVRTSQGRVYLNAVNGGTSLASPLFAGFEADLIQGRHGISLGFANPMLYNMAGTAAFHDITSSPQGRSVTEATVFGPAYQLPPRLSTMGQCASTHHLACGPGYDTVAGLGSPGTAFFSSFGSQAG